IPSYADKPPRRILSGWLPDYSLSRNLPTVEGNLDLIRDVSPFWYGLVGENSIKDKYALGKYTTPKEQVIARLKSNNILLLPTITDDNGKLVLANLLAKESSRNNIVQSLKSLVLRQNYDGIDLDFETFYTKDGRSSWPALKPNWILFIQQLSAELRAQGKLLSVTTPPDFAKETKRAGNSVYSWAEIGPYIDRLRIMAYDFSTTSPGPIGPIEWTEDAVKYAVTQMPASKVFLGIPGYGRDWVTKVEGTCPSAFASSVVVGAKAAVVMREALNLATINNSVPVYNAKYAESTFSYKKTYMDPTNSAIFCTASRTVWFPDEKSYAIRTNLVGKYRLGGIAVWTFGMENVAAMSAVREIAKSIAPDQVVATLSSDLEQISYGSIVNLSATFKLPDKTPVSALNVRFEIKNSSDANWRSFAAGITDSAGTISVPVVIGEKSLIRLISEGSWEREEGRTAEKNISVIPKVILPLPTSVKAGANYVITGQLLPRVASIKLNVLQDGKPKESLTTDANGNFTLTIAPTTTGIHTYQFQIDAGPKNSATSSELFTILVR
ncbi:MAG: glycosyl hydrolase, partial [Actinobacteria bacterium]|nr:glycosyl hydrolase [Actinomycetota bacterium]